jgi:lipopolysaccharide/colanic/teichoic acid biosynthesis glycosyltransferase
MIQVRMVTPLARFVGSGVRVDKLAGYYMFSMERGIVQLLWGVIKRVMDIAISILVLPFSAVFSLFYYLFGVLAGHARFYKERCSGARGRMITIPRIRGASGREVGDLFKVSLFVQVLMGRMSLIGPPPRPAEGQFAATSDGAMVYRPGVTGIWRISPGSTYMESYEEELALLQNRSFARDLLILVRSVRFAFKGSYPRWFDTRGDDR